MHVWGALLKHALLLALLTMVDNGVKYVDVRLWLSWDGDLNGSGEISFLLKTILFEIQKKIKDDEIAS